MLAALLFGAALALPAMLELVLAFGQRSARHALAVWFWADSRQQLSGLSLALMALLLALAVNVGVGTMVETFSRTFITWLDRRLAADVYVNASDDAQAYEIKAWLRRRPEVQAILPGGRAETHIAGAPVEILGLPDDATYRDRWPLLRSTGNAWVRLRPGDAGFISEQLARRMNLGLGDRIEVPAPGGNWALEVVGIYADYGNPKGQVAVIFAALTRRFPNMPQTRLGLRVTPGGIPALMSALQDQFGLDGSNLVDQATLKASSKRIFNRTFAVTAALNTFTLGVAGVALLTSLLTLANSRSAATGPVMGDRTDAAAACRDRTRQDHVGRADHDLAGAAARLGGGVVPDHGGEREGVRLAAAVRGFPAATALARRRGNAGRAVRRTAAGDQTGTHAAGEPDQDIRR